MRITLKQVFEGYDGRLDRKDASLYLGVSSKTIAEWQRKGFGPKSHKVGGRRFYHLSDLKAFLNAAGASA